MPGRPRPDGFEPTTTWFVDWASPARNYMSLKDFTASCLWIFPAGMRS